MKSTNKYVIVIRTVLITGGAYVINLLITLLLTPYITSTVGTEAYGFVTLANNFVQYATVIAVALNSFATRHIAVSYHHGNKDKACEFYSSVFFGDLALGSLLFAIAFVCILSLDSLLVIPKELVADVKILFLFVFIGFWVTTVFTAFNAMAVLKNKLDITGIFKGLSYTTEAAILIIFYVLFPPMVFYVGLGIAGAAVVVAIGNVYISKKYVPDLHVSFKSARLAAIKRLVLDGVWTSANQLGEMLNNGLDLIVCNLMLTPLAMGQLAIAKSIGTMFHTIFSIVNQAFQPMFLKSYSEGNIEKLLGELKLSMKASGMLSTLAFACFVALGISFYKLWIPNQDIHLIYWLTVLTVATVVPGGPMQPLYYIYVLTVKRKIPCLITIAGGVLNVISMYVMIAFFNVGVYAVPVTTLVVMCVINYITNPLYMAHVLRLPWQTFYPEIIRNFLACVGITLLLFALSQVHSPSSWIAFCLCAVAYALLGAVVYLMIVCSRNERTVLVHTFLKKN